MRILYVEDNELVREITTELLARSDRELVALATAEQALQEFRRQPCDVVITDVGLPVMSGLDLARKLLRQQPALPIIIASGYALTFDFETWGSKVRCITKPFGALDIDSLIAELLPAGICPLR